MSSQPQRYSAYCEAHGLHYEAGQSGCVLCRRGEAPTVTEERSSTPIIVAGLLLVLALGAFLGLRDREEGPPAAAAGEPPTAPLAEEGMEADTRSGNQLPAAIGGKLDPEPLRPEMEELERALYGRSPQPTLLANRVDALAARSREFPPPVDGPSYRIWLALDRNLKRFGTDVWAWGQRRSHGDLVRLRESWEGIRKRSFFGAPWFDGGDDLSFDAQAERRRLDSERGRTVELLDRLILVHRELSMLANEAQAAAYTVPEVMLKDLEKPRKEAQWNEAARRWEEGYRQRVPEVPRITRTEEHDLSRIAGYLKSASRSLARDPFPRGRYSVSNSVGERQYTSVPPISARQRGVGRVLAELDNAQRVIERVSAKWH